MHRRLYSNDCISTQLHPDPRYGKILKLSLRFTLYRTHFKFLLFSDLCVFPLLFYYHASRFTPLRVDKLSGKLASVR